MANGLLAYVTPLASSPISPTPAPYNPSSLHVPLSETERVIIINWLEAIPDLKGSIKAALPNESDAQVLARYSSVVSTLHQSNFGPLQPILGAAGDATIGAVGVYNAGVDIAHFLGRLTQGATWVRIGEFAAGIILVGIGAHAFLHSNETYQRTVSRPISKAVKGAGLVTEVRASRNINSMRREAGRTNARASTAAKVAKAVVK